MWALVVWLWWYCSETPNHTLVLCGVTSRTLLWYMLLFSYHEFISDVAGCRSCTGELFTAHFIAGPLNNAANGISTDRP